MPAIAGKDRLMSLVIFSIVIFDDMTFGVGWVKLAICKSPLFGEACCRA